MAGYIGNVPVPQATQTRDVFTATSGQTSFATSGYTPGFLDVFLNGVKLVSGTDFTASNGSDVVLSSGATAGDDIEVVSYTTFEVVDQSFGGNFSVDSPTFVVDAANNRVGVGLTSTAARLDVRSTSTSETTFRALNNGTNWAQVAVGFNGASSNYYDADTHFFRDGATQAELVRITNTGRVGIGGTGNPGYPLDVQADGGGASVAARIQNLGTTASDHSQLRLSVAGTTADNYILFGDADDTDRGGIRYDHTNDRMSFRAGAADRMYVHANGHVSIASTINTYDLNLGTSEVNTLGSDGQDGWAFTASSVRHQTDTTTMMVLNDTSAAAGTHNYIVFYYQGASIGDIDTTDNSTIRYNTFTGAHWSQMHGSSDLLRGTVMSTIDELVEWTTFEFTNAEGGIEKTTMAGRDYVVGQIYTINIDEDGATAEGVATGYDTASRLMRVKVSDVEGDPAVYGVFAGAYADGDISVEALGAGVIRIGQGVTVQRGDLLMSAGDGTAKPQDDDIVRSKTIAKVTGNVVLETFDDGSYLVACVLMAG